VDENGSSWCPVAVFGVSGAEFSGSVQEIIAMTKKCDAFISGFGFYSAVRFFQSTQSVDGLSPILC